MTVLPPPVGLLESRLGVEPLTGADAERASAALEDAAALVLAEVPAATAALWSASAPTVVLTVVLKAARREFENPQGLRSETLGEHGYTVATASGVYLTAAERAIVRRAARLNVAGLVLVRTPSAYVIERRPFAPAPNSTKPLPLPSL